MLNHIKPPHSYEHAIHGKRCQIVVLRTIQRMSEREIVRGSVGKFGSTNGTEICQVIKHVSVCFSLAGMSLSKTYRDQTHRLLLGLAFPIFDPLFNALNWKNYLGKGICPMNEFPCKGLMHKSIAGAEP